MKDLDPEVVPKETLEYWNYFVYLQDLCIMEMRSASGWRTELHNDMCKVYGLEHDATTVVTDNCNDFENNGGALALHKALLELSHGK